MSESLFSLPKPENIPDSQKFAITITLATLEQMKSFVFDRYFEEKFVFIFGKLNNEDCCILPVYHDFQLDADEIRSFAEEFPERNKFLSMCAPDGSCIFYSANPVDWNLITNKSNDSDSE